MDFLNSIGSGTMVLTIVPFAIVAVVFVVIALRSQVVVRASGRWETTYAQVIYASVEARRSRSGTGTSTTYYPNVIYQYQVNGQMYQGNRVTLGSSIGLGSYSAVQKTVDQYAIGSTIPIFYNPVNPAEAVIERRAPSSRMFLFIAVVIILILTVTVIFTTSMLGNVNQLISGLMR
jgi:hypothetical protein